MGKYKSKTSNFIYIKFHYGSYYLKISVLLKFQGKFILTFNYGNHSYGLNRDTIEGIARDGLASCIHMEIEVSVFSFNLSLMRVCLCDLHIYIYLGLRRELRMQVAHCQAQGEASSSYGGADMYYSMTGVTIQDIDRSYTRKRKCYSGFTF